MGIDLSIGFFVNDATFLPTTEQLVGIAAILEEAGVIDHAERKSLEQRITATYFGEETPLVLLNSTYVLGFYDYTKISSDALPYFDHNFMGGEVRVASHCCLQGAALHTTDGRRQIYPPRHCRAR